MADDTYRRYHSGRYGEMSEKKKKRKADQFAGEGSVAGEAKRRREAIESGDPSGGRKVWNPKTKKYE